MNVCLLNVGQQLYREVCLCNTVLASHIDTTALADGAYELIPESEGGDPEAQVNATTNRSPGPKSGRAQG